MKINSTTGQLRNKYLNFALSSFLGVYCFTDQKDGSIKYFGDIVEAQTKAIELSWVHSVGVSIKPVQNQYVITLNLG